MGCEEDLVVLYETDGPLEIGMVKSALDAAAIPYCVTNDTISTVLPCDGMLIVRFEVRRCDAQAAREALADMGLECSEP